MVETTRCANCERLEKLVQQQSEQIAELTARVAQLERQLAAAQKNSRTSSKPPSSDIISPPAAKKRRQPAPDRKRKSNQRVAFEPEMVDRILNYHAEVCPCCGGALQAADDLPVRVHQHAELPQRLAEISEHRLHPGRCTDCGQMHYPALPEQLAAAGLVGPRLTALVGFLKGPCHASYSAIRKFFRDVVGVRISRGLLAKLIAKTTTALADPYEELLRLLTDQAVLNVDETGHKDCGQRFWAWCFCAATFTVFKVSPTRSAEVLDEVLGEEFQGILGCDYYSAYHKFIRQRGVLAQFCLAHLIRDVRFLAEHPDAANRAYGERLLGHLRRLFEVYHRREEYPSEAGWQRALGRIRKSFVWDATMEVCDTPEASNLAERFYKHCDAYFRFITEPDVDPTNNLAEQAIRFVAIHRRVTQGTRGEIGRQWLERMSTVVTTCEQQSRSAFDFIVEAITAHLDGHPAPTLVPQPEPG